MKIAHPSAKYYNNFYQTGRMMSRCHPRVLVGGIGLVAMTFFFLLNSGSENNGRETSLKFPSASHDPDPQSLVPCPAEGNPFRLACLQSYGFFQTIHEDDWKMEQQRARTAEHHPDPATQAERGWFNPKPTSVQPTWLERWQPSYWFMDHYQPIFTCPHVRRVGGLADGGKWVCDIHRLRELVLARRKLHGNDKEKCLIYSVGSNGNFDFENGLIEALGASDICEIHVFDFDDWGSPQLREKNIFFHQWGLTSKESHGKGDGGWRQSHMVRSVELLSFQETQERLGHSGRAIDIFKIDCESCEWKSYKDWMYAGDIRQILIETHGFPPRPMKPTELFEDFQNNNFIMYSKEPNMIGRMLGALEWSFIRLHPDFLGGKTNTAAL